MQSDAPSLTLDAKQILAPLEIENCCMTPKMGIKSPHVLARNFNLTIFICAPHKEQDSAMLEKLLVNVYGWALLHRLWNFTSHLSFA